MNGGVVEILKTTNEASGSKKRKRGLAPKKKLQDKTEAKLSAILAPAKSMVEPIYQNGHYNQMEQLCAMCGQPSKHDLINISENPIMKEELISMNLPAESTLTSICVQCVVKINAQKDCKRSVKIRLQRVPNGQMCNSIAQLQQTQSKTVDVKSALSKEMLQADVAKEATTSTCASDASLIKCLENVTTVPEPNSLCGTDANLTQLHLPTLSVITSVITISSANSIYDKSSAYNTPTSANQQLHNEIVNLTSTQSTPTHLAAVEPNQCNITEVGTKKLVKQTQVDAQTENVKLQTSTPITTPRSQQILMHTSASNSLHSVEAQHQSMLEVYCVRSESALITESGGMVNNYEQKSSAPKQLICQHCARAYWHKYHYARHVRRCHSRYRHLSNCKTSKSAIYIRCADMDPTEVQDDVKYARVFHCTECRYTAHSIVRLRQHKRCHLQINECDICFRQYTTLHEYNFHRAVCLAQNEVLKNSFLVADDDEAVSTYMSIGRITRARSRALSRACTHITDTCNSIAGNDSEDYVDIYDDDVDDDDVSVADTMYSNRMRFTGNWVEDHSNSNSNISVYADILEEEQQISSYKEYDLYLLDRLKACVHSNIFTCFVPDCNFRTDTLPSLMMHDYVDHFRHAWFHCKKCSCVFTRKVFLDYHLDRQNGGRFICFRCGDIFEFQHELDRHLIRHTKSVNYRCNYCKFEFLTKNELLQHCDIEQHDPHGIRGLIRFNPIMTIVNPVPSTFIYSRGTYAERIFVMKLPKTASKRPLELHKPYRRKIGDVLFRNQKNPNCWGWK